MTDDEERKERFEEETLKFFLEPLSTLSLNLPEAPGVTSVEGALTETRENQDNEEMVEKPIPNPIRNMSPEPTEDIQVTFVARGFYFV